MSVIADFDGCALSDKPNSGQPGVQHLRGDYAEDCHGKGQPSAAGNSERPGTNRAARRNLGARGQKRGNLPDHCDLASLVYAVCVVNNEAVGGAHFDVNQVAEIQVHNMCSGCATESVGENRQGGRFDSRPLQK